MASKDKKISGEIVVIHKIIDSYSDESELLLCDISWNDRAPRTELRIVKKNGHFGSGIAITKDNIKKLSKCIDLLDDNKTEEQENKEEVNFENIFKNGTKISKLREDGYLTKNSKISLKKK